MFLFLGIVIDAIRAGRGKGENRLRGKAKSGKNVGAQEKEWNLGYLFSPFLFPSGRLRLRAVVFFKMAVSYADFFVLALCKHARKKCSFASMRIVKKNRGKNDDAVVSNIFAEIMIQMKAPVLSRVIFDSYPRFFVRRETRLHTRAFKMAESLVGKAAQVHSYRNVQQIHIEHVDLRIGISENAKRLVIRFSDV